MPVCNVLYVAQTSKGGSAFSLYYLVKGLDRGRYNPTVLFYSQDDPYIPDKLAALGVRVINLGRSSEEPSAPSGTGPQPRRDIGRWLTARLGSHAGRAYSSLKSLYWFLRWRSSSLWAVARAIRDSQAKLVHINNGLLMGQPAIVAARLLNVPSLCHVRMFSEISRGDLIFARWVRACLYISTAIADDCVRQGVPAAKGIVVHNAVDVSEFAAAWDVAEVKREFGWTPAEPVVGVVGRLDWWKGHEYFLEAFASVSRQVPNLRGLIIGAPETLPRSRAYFAELQSRARSLGLEDKVRFTGFRDDIPRLMSALDVVVLSSARPEPFGRVVIEGMAAGKPVVATAAGGVLDVIEDGVTGVLVPCGDSQKMAEAITGLLIDPERARRIGLAAARLVEEKFSLRSQATAIQAVYDTVLASPARRQRPTQARAENFSR